MIYDEKQLDTEIITVSDICFKCGERIDRLPCIVWHGPVNEQSVDIFLHTECAKSLSEHLMSDLKKLNER